MHQITTHKKDIRPSVLKALTAAKRSIYLAIGWLGDKSLFGLLEKKALEGLDLKMILQKDSNNEPLKDQYKQLEQQGIQLFWLEKSEKEKLIDHKFVLIDSSMVLTGNYNWGHLNPPPEESLTITKYVPTLVQGFKEEFEYLMVLNQLPKTDPRPRNTIGELLRKLNVLKVLLGIGDTEFIHLRLQILDAFAGDVNVEHIHQTILDQSFEEALTAIKEFIHFHQPLQACIEPPIENLRREIQRIEEEIASISQEYNETQKVIHEFSKLHSEELGDLLQKILHQSKIKAEIEAKLNEEDPEKQEVYEEAKADQEAYNKSYEAAKQQKFNVLTPAQKKELKKLYRQTSLRCHPDRVVEDLHAQAEEIFVELNEAYKANDLERVKEISAQVKSGAMLSKSEAITELKKLESTVNSLKQKLQDWLTKLDDLKALPTFQTVSSIDDWNVYFADTKVILQDQLDRLQRFNENMDKNLLEQPN